jgi:RND superfamily putative drug exporter
LSPDAKTAIITAVPRHDVGDKQVQDLVYRIRSDAKQTLANALLSRTSLGSRRAANLSNIYVGGAQADYGDFNDAMYEHFPLIIAIVLVLTYCFLFFAFRSAFLPLKAVLLNLISVGASYGLLQLVFQRGVGAQVLRFTPETGVAPWVPIFLFAFLFGLSMDYEVFLLSRVRERWLGTRDNAHSVAFGLEKTGRLISSAAAIMVVAFSGFLVGSEIQLKQFGFGMLASVALDASLIRVVLVPSIMELMGNLNWWVPSRLRAFANRGVPFSEGEAPEPATA